MVTSIPNFLEALPFPAYVALYIWHWQTAIPESWIVFPLWLLLSFVLHRDTPKTIGWRADNLQSATRRAAPIFLFLSAAIFAIGMPLGAPHLFPSHFV